jgi:hypothetical protein
VSLKARLAAVELVGSAGPEEIAGAGGGVASIVHV